MTPLAAGQRWVPSDGNPGMTIGSIEGNKLRWFSATDSGVCFVSGFEDWIARHAAVLEQGEDGG